MSYLDTITFEESSLLEGEQAEAYKAKKAKEKADKEAAERNRYSTRYDNDRYGRTYTSRNPEYQKDKQAANNNDEKAMDRMDDRMADDAKRMNTAAHKANKDYYSGKRPMNHDENSRAIDATNRHMRRHPKQYKEAVELAESLLESYQPDCIFC